VLFGRTLSDLVRNTATFVVMVLVAFIIGFRIHGSVIGFIGASFLLLYFSYAFSWVQALIGLSVNSVETANSAGFIWMFPLTFLSSAFVSTAGMTPWLRRVADANPFTRVANAARALYNGNPTHGTVWQAFGWATLITVVFATLSIRKFSRVSSR
jgi:ABC-2 type transport system permease protein/oleandomycin transport system permease protein